jgi:general secretion pathway protein M
MTTLRERYDKLQARERRLLAVLGAMLVGGILLLLPVGIASMVSSARSENQAIRDVIDQIYDARPQIAERRAKREALLGRYAKPAPPLAGFIDEAAKANGITAAESQDRPEAPHGKRYTERNTYVKMHKVGLLALAKTFEAVEQSGYPVALTRLSLKPRSGEPDSYEVEVGVSAYDRKPDAPTPSSSAAPAASAGDKDKDL